ncbi:hypothetical protein ACS0TY_014948 [Phlomoides rotata]
MGASRFSLIRLKNTAVIAARLFSSSAAVHRPWSYFGEVSKESHGESAVYTRALKLQRPTTVQYIKSLGNSVSLIGEIERPLTACNSSKVGVHTLLKVKSTGVCGDFSRIMLKFWNEMAEMSIQHLKPNDLVYVSGSLRSYMKVEKDGKPMRGYEVNVTEMNFVSRHSSGPGSQNCAKSEQEGAKNCVKSNQEGAKKCAKLEQEVSAEDIMQKRRDRLHLWQIFFANPHEWWDNRNNKLNPRMPDYKHKDTGEALWLTNNDPPWINQQLQLLDSRLSKQSPGQPRNGRSKLSPLVFDDL